MGVDVSDAMLAEAKRNCRERNLDYVSFVKSDDRLSCLEGTFDLIHSLIVFQHIAPRRVEVLVRGLLARIWSPVASAHCTSRPGCRCTNGNRTGSRRRCRR